MTDKIQFEKINVDLKGELFNSNKKNDEYQSYIKVLQSQNEDLTQRLIAFKEEHDINILQKINTIRDLDERMIELRTEKDRNINELAFKIKEKEMHLNDNKIELEEHKRLSEDTINILKNDINNKEEKIFHLEKSIIDNEQLYITNRLYNEKEITDLKNEITEYSKTIEINLNKIQYLEMENNNLNKTMTSLKDDYDQTTLLKINIIRELEEKLHFTQSDKYNIETKLTSEFKIVEGNQRLITDDFEKYRENSEKTIN